MECVYRDSVSVLWGEWEEEVCVSLEEAKKDTTDRD